MSPCLLTAGSHVGDPSLLEEKRRQIAVGIVKERYGSVSADEDAGDGGDRMSMRVLEGGEGSA